MLDFLAYSILVLTFIFVILPIAGSIFAIDDSIGYLDSIKLGFNIVIIMFSTILIISSCIWAFHYTFK